MKIVEFMGPDASVTVPIQGDGGRERVIESLTYSLARKVGREKVDLIAQTGSYSEEFIIRPVRFTRGLDAQQVLREARYALSGKITCDILHVHHPAYLPAREFVEARKIVLTHHGAIDHPRNFDADGVTFVSYFLRDWMGAEQLDGNRIAVIHNPVEVSDRLPKASRQRRLGFMGTIHKPVKRVDVALDLADRLNIPIVLAGPCDSGFLKDFVLPRLKNGSKYIGELKSEARQDFFESVTCVVCPSDVPEAFCMVAAESMACGTPVLASRSGGLPEVVTEGCGFLCSSLDDFVLAFNRLKEISYLQCVESIARRFSAAGIAQDYLDFFHKLLRE